MKFFAKGMSGFSFFQIQFYLFQELYCIFKKVHKYRVLQLFVGFCEYSSLHLLYMDDTTEYDTSVKETGVKVMLVKMSNV